MSSNGWIKLHRQIREHWTYKEPRRFSRFEAWIDLLLSANHEPTKILLGNRLIPVERGQFITSQVSLGRTWGWNRKTVKDYFQILEDTLVGFLLPAYHKSVRKQQSQNPKFYFFDLGVKRSLDGTLVQPPVQNTYGYGKCFEHYIVLEMIRLNDYYEKDYHLSYLRTKDQAEIDDDARCWTYVYAPGQKGTSVGKQGK